MVITPALYGDADLDGSVTFNDFLVLQNHFGQFDATTAEGDFDYNGVVNFNDFLVLQNNFGHTTSGTATSLTAAQSALINTFASTIPEPAGLIGLAGGGLLLRRRRV